MCVAFVPDLLNVVEKLRWNYETETRAQTHVLNETEQQWLPGTEKYNLIFELSTLLSINLFREGGGCFR